MTPRGHCIHTCTCGHRWMSVCRASSGSYCQDCGTLGKIRAVPTYDSKIRNWVRTMGGGCREEEEYEDGACSSLAHVCIAVRAACDTANHGRWIEDPGG